MARKGGEGRGVYEEPVGSGRFRIQYVDQYGERKRENAGRCTDEKHGDPSHKCPVRRKAVTLARKRREQAKEAKLFPAPAPKKRPTLGDALVRCMEESRALNRTWKDNLRYANAWGDAMGDIPLDEIKASDVEAWRRKKLSTPIDPHRGAARPRKAGTDGKPGRVRKPPEPKGPSSPKFPTPATVNRYVAFLRHVFNMAVRDEMCEKNPCNRVRQMRENNIRTRYLTLDEERALRKAFPPEHWHFVLVAIHTGLRQSEQLALRWEHVDFTAGELTIPRSKHGEKRHIPMNRAVTRTLRAMPSRMRSEWVYPAPPEETRRGRKRKADIGHITFASIRSAFERSAEKAGVQDLNWHDLRRTFCSRLVMKGIDLPTVQTLMGHKSLAMILRYAHLSPGHRQEAVAKLDDDEDEVFPETSPKHPMSDGDVTGTA